jgi:hypothetical protein
MGLTIRHAGGHVEMEDFSMVSPTILLWYYPNLSFGSASFDEFFV